MTFPSEEVRHAFHQLPVQIQDEIRQIWSGVLKHGYFLSVESVTGLEVSFRIHQEPVTHNTAPADFS